MNHSWLISISTKHWIVSCSAIPVCTCTCICIASKGRRNGRDRDQGDTFAFIATITKLVVGKNRSHLDLLDLLLYISCDKILFDWDLLLLRHLSTLATTMEREREREREREIWVLLLQLCYISIIRISLLLLFVCVYSMLLLVLYYCIISVREVKFPFYRDKREQYNETCNCDSLRSMPAHSARDWLSPGFEEVAR